MIGTTLDIAGLDGGRVRMGPAQLDALRSQITGSLPRSGEPGWDQAVRIWNGMAAKTPAVVLQPSSPADVAAGVRSMGFSRWCGQSVTRAGHVKEIARDLL